MASSEPGSTLDVADDRTPRRSVGPASRGRSAFPQLRFVSLVENGTHVLFASEMAGYGTSEITLAKAVLGRLEAGMLCLADRQFFGFALWSLARATTVWRVKKNMRLVPDRRLPDGSYLRYSPPTVRAIDYRLEGVAGAEPVYDHERGAGA